MFDGGGPPRRGLFDPVPQISELTPEQRKLLEGKWLDMQQELELAMAHGEIPGSGFLFDPRLDVLKGRILTRWRDLCERNRVCWLLIPHRENGR